MINEIQSCHSCTEHFFNPCCEKLPIWKRVGILGIHLLLGFTVLLAYAICHVVSYCFPKSNGEISNQFVSSGIKGKAYSPEGQMAIAFAKDKLAEFPDIQPYEFNAEFQPINQDIARLFQLKVDKLMPACVAAKNNPHKSLSAINDLMKVSYAISCLALEDLDNVVQEITAQKHALTNRVDALVRDDAYLFEACFCCTSIYHMIRLSLHSLDSNSSKLFYQAQGPYYSNWRVLYNDYCQRVRNYVDEEELGAYKSQCVAWIQEDTDATTFVFSPELLPI